MATPEDNLAEPARTACAARGRSSSGRTYDGRPMPEWDGFGDTIHVGMDGGPRRRAAHASGRGGMTWQRL
jgi:hypothetical protein